MSRELTTASGLVAIPDISYRLRNMMDRQRVTIHMGGEEGRRDGCDFTLGSYEPPDWVFTQDREEALATLAAIQQLAAPPPEARIIDFLNMLWIATKHTKDISWSGVLSVYPRMLRRIPAYCWRPERLEDAALTFIWFPAVAELAEFHAYEKAKIERDLDALDWIVKWATSGTEEEYRQYMKEQWEKMPPHRRETYDQRMAREREELKAAAMRPRSANGNKPEPLAQAPASTEALRQAYAATGLKPGGWLRTEEGQEDAPTEEDDPGKQG